MPPCKRAGRSRASGAEDEPDFHVMAWQEPDDEIDSESWVEIGGTANCGRRINGGLRNE